MGIRKWDICLTFSGSESSLTSNLFKSNTEIPCVNSNGLSLNTDINDLYNIARTIGEEYKMLIENGAGRLLRAATLWEDATKTLFTTNCSWNLTQNMCEKICSELFVSPAPSGNYPFPTPEIINKYSSGKLKKMISVGYRNEYLKSLD